MKMDNCLAEVENVVRDHQNSFLEFEVEALK